MPANHGLYRKVTVTSDGQKKLTGVPVCRFGIWRIFDALRMGHFSLTQEDRHKAANLEDHFHEVIARFLFSIQELDRLMQKLAQTYSDANGRAGLEVRDIMFQSQCFADHVMSYLNIIVDDIAMMTALAMRFNVGSVESMNNLYKRRKATEFASVKALLEEFDSSESWWGLGFKHRQGIRQKLVHNQHLTQFQISKPPSKPYEAKAFLMAPTWGNTGPAINFFEISRSILTGLFDWLDRLEKILIDHLSEESPAWVPAARCPAMPLPLSYSQGITRYSEDYFPVPLCGDSDALPWVISVRYGVDAVEVAAL